MVRVLIKSKILMPFIKLLVIRHTNILNILNKDCLQKIKLLFSLNFLVDH
jgi:hypothetical protein